VNSEIKLRESNMKYGKVTDLKKGEPINIILNLKRKLMLVIISSVLVSILCPCAYGGGDPKCGDELQIETRNGTSMRGKLWLNDGYHLILRSDIHLKSFAVSDTVLLSDVAEVFEIKRKTGTGAILGLVAGTALGAGVGYAVSSNIEREEDDLFGFDTMERQFETVVAITVVGSVVGLAIGAMIGNSAQTLKEVEPLAIPICFSPSTVRIPLRLSIIYNF
jgi:hypothetical protein